jgi:hypothetical protein
VQNFQGEGVLTVTRSRGGGEHPLDPNQSIWEIIYCLTNLTNHMVQLNIV